MNARANCGFFFRVLVGVLAGVFCFCASTIAVPPDYRGTESQIVYEDSTATTPSLRPERGEHLLSRGEAAFSLPTTGADFCNLATVVSVPVGPPGSPSTVTITGDSSPATVGTECLGSSEPWWEAFEIATCANVTIDLCGTDPIHSPNWSMVAASCAVDGSTCGDYKPGSVAFGICTNPETDNNITLVFSGLAAGTYYYPIITQNGATDISGPYTMHISAEEGTGTCCDTALETCQEDTAPGSCAGVDQIFTCGARCCEVECRDPGPEYDALDVELLSRVPLADFASNSTMANDVWGYTSPRGRKYAIIGLTDGTGFVEVTDPRNPVVIADIPDAHSIWSDMAVYGEYAYNVNENSGGMQIIDLRQIDDGIVTLLGSAGGGMQTAHNVYVNPESGFAFPCGTDAGSGFLSFDLADAANPQPVGAWNGSYVHDLQVINYDACPVSPPHPRAGLPCEIAFAFAGYNGFKIVDVTDKTAMSTISTLTYPTLEYCHQGWLSTDLNYVFLNDELDEQAGNVTSTRTYVIDVSDLKFPSLVHTYDHGGCWIDHNLMVRENRVYEAHYAAGLRVLDAANPLSLLEVAHFDTRPEDNAQDFPGAWGVFTGFPVRTIAVSDRQRGLFVLCDQPQRSIPGFTVSANPAVRGEPIDFDASGSTTCDPARSLTGYEWDFDYDGVTFDVDSTGAAPSHTYATAGTYTTGLRVTDDLASTEVTTFDIQVTPPVPAVSHWGLIVLGLLVLVSGTMVMHKCRAIGTNVRA